MTNFISVVGTVFVDCKGFANEQYNALGRNLGSIQFVHGGVGRNVVENLANLGLSTALVSTVDDSALGEDIKKRLKQLGVSLEYLPATPNQGMGMWLALLNENGELVGSISQMPNLTTMQHMIMQRGEEIVSGSSHLVLEIDLNEQISRHMLEIASRHNKPVYGIPGNLEVILKNRDLLTKLDCFICNNIEAEQLVCSDFSDMALEQKLAALQTYVEEQGLQAMVITLGSEGSIFYDRIMKESGYQPVFPVEVIDTSGAGDAFFSGTIMGLVRGLKLAEAVVYGTKVAGWTIESKENNCQELKEKMQQDEAFQKLLVK
ncbi:carbohydrate kinase family protein [Paenibacillus sp. UNC451MF]|uniref:carbohydrate kinase family protein n=1 Tax=Paenibacillus sp. UNC451MF TaxID=1449063 RepID=UPI00048F93DA|nr:carbohydrate kinase family protein [Paenibacillus sp. UNC451MF]